MNASVLPYRREQLTEEQQNDSKIKDREYKRQEYNGQKKVCRIYINNPVSLP